MLQIQLTKIDKKKNVLSDFSLLDEFIKLKVETPQVLRKPQGTFNYNWFITCREVLVSHGTFFLKMINDL